MTYPPQPGQGGPDPYGQGGPQQPGTGGVPQQPGWDPNAQQQGWDPGTQQYGQQPSPGTQPYGQPYQQQYPGTQQYPQQGWDPNQPPYGGGPQPPKNNKTGLWIGIAVAVVVVVALGITGFVAPGFFLSKDSSGSSTAQSSNPVPPPAAPSRPQQLPTDEPSEPGLPTDETDIPGTGDGGASPAEAKQAIDDFVAKINAKDNAGATGMTCQGTESFSKDSIDEATGGEPQLQVEGYDGTATVTASLTGSLSGKDANGSVIATNTGGNWCIGFFFVLAI